MMTPAQFHSALMGYCYATMGSVSSYGRTQKHNAHVGGHPDSNHLQWLAADVIYDEPWVKAACDRVARRYGLEVIREDDHDHIEPLP